MNVCTQGPRKENPRLICKLGLEKAFNRVNWQFLQGLLQRMGFGEKWRGWVQECVPSACFSIMVNGSPKGLFEAQGGIRQGDPLSLLFFLSL